ncbi:MAG: phosphatase PAP2 family protein [Actinomycetota bacterium]
MTGPGLPVDSSGNTLEMASPATPTQPPGTAPHRRGGHLPAGGPALPRVGRYGARATLLAVALVLVGIPFGLLLHQVATEGPVTGLDDDVALELNARVHDEPLVVALLEGISFLGKPITLVVLMGGVVVWALARRARRLALFLAVTGIGAGVVNTSLKVAVGRARPEVDVPVHEALGLSFPSGHAMFSTACYGALLVALLPLVPAAWRRAARWATVLLVIAIGFTRLALGVHFLTDVLGGHVLGLAWLLASVAAFEAWRSDQWLGRTHPLDEGIDPEGADALIAAGRSPGLRRGRSAAARGRARRCRRPR